MRSHTRSVANIHSPLKAHKRSEKKRLRNQAAKNRARTMVVRVRQSIETGDLQAANENLSAAFSALDKAAAKGILHPNNAARRKARLTKALAKARQA